MVFDEAIKYAKELSFVQSYEDVYEYNLVIDLEDVIEILENLKQEYKPTIEMTAKEKEHLLSIATTSVTFTNFYEQVLKQSTNIKFGVQTTPELYKHLSENELMQAWLHQDTIKVKGD